MKKMVYGAAVALALLATGCTGSFRLVQTVHGWHTDFEQRWTDEGCYLLSCLIFYPAAYAFDTIFLNSIEFWLGENPIPAATADVSVTRIDANTALVQSKASGETYTLRRTAEGTLTLTDAQGSTITAEAQGSLLTMTLPDGTTRTQLM